MITISNVIKKYNGIPAVHIDQLELHPGEVIGLVGNNGAGKTTLFRLLLDLVRCDEGEILSKGKPVASSEEWKNYTSAFIDEGFLIGYLTPEEYFVFVGKLHHLGSGEVNAFLQSYSDFFDVTQVAGGKYIRDFSRGNQCKIGIMAALLTGPELLILDEPFANLDPTSQLILIEMIKMLTTDKSRCIIVSSHDISQVSEVSSRILLMEKGKIIKDIHGGKAAYPELVDYFRIRPRASET